MYDQIITALLEVVIAVCIIIVSKYLVPWLKNKSFYESIDRIMDLAQTYVIYAEKIITGYKKGDDRFDFVVGLLTPIIKSLKLKFNEDQIKAIVQAAYDMVIGFPDTADELADSESEE